MKDYVDSLVVIPNDKLLLLSDQKTKMLDALNLANEILKDGVQGITEIITGAGFINVDFADVRAVMSRQGVAHMGIGRGTGDNRVKEAVKAAVSSPLLETNVAGARHILLRISGDENLGMLEFSEAADMIEQEADGDADVRIGMTIDNSLGDEIVITVIATGFSDMMEKPDFILKTDKEGFRPPSGMKTVGFDDNYELEPGAVRDGGADYNEFEPLSEQETLPLDEAGDESDGNDFAIPGFLRGE